MKRAIRYFGILVFVVLALVFLVLPERKSEASVYKAFNYQGKLLDNAGWAVADGDYSITFLIYDDPAAGSCLWTARGTCGSPTAKTIAVSGGIFSTMLGEAGDNALPDFTSDAYYLEVRIDYGGSPQTLTPRKRIGSVPQALNANALVGDGVINLTSSATSTNAAGITVNSLTTGNGLAVSSSSLSSGALINLTQTGTAAASNTQTGLKISMSGANATATQTTYGGYITNTHTGTASTNVGLYLSASGGTNNFALSVPNGKVAIGSNALGALTLLDVSTDPTDSNQPSGLQSASSDTHTALTITGTGNAINEKLGLQYALYSTSTTRYSIGGIFGAMSSLAGNTVGYITVDMRATTGATSLTEVLRIDNNGLLTLLGGVTNPTTSTYGITFGGTVAGTPDVNLYRSGENYLKTDDNFVIASPNVTGTTTSSALSISANSLTTGTGLYAASSTLSSGSLVNLVVTGTAAAGDTQRALNISTSGANATATQTTYGGYIANTHTGTTSTNVGLFVSASGGTTNYSIDARGNQRILGGELIFRQDDADPNHTYYNVLQYHIDNLDQVGAIDITLPNVSTSSMLSIKISGYNYLTNSGSWEAIIGGYWYTNTSNWLQASTEIRGSAPFKRIRLMKDGSNAPHIVLGEITDTWQYPQINVDVTIAGYAGQYNWASGWSGALSADISALTASAEPTIKSYMNVAGDLGIGTVSQVNKVQIYDISTTASRAGLYVSQVGAIAGTGYGGFFTKTGASTVNEGIYTTASGATTNYGTYTSATGAATTNYGLYTSASGATTNYGLYVAAGTGYFGSDIQLAQISAPAPTTDKLYNVSGNLYWNGVNLSGGGALPSGTSGQTLRHDGASWAASSILTNDGTNIDISSRLGIGTSASSNYTLVVGETFTMTSGAKYGIKTDQTFSPSGPLVSAATAVGLEGSASWDSAQDGSSYGYIRGVSAFTYTLGTASGALNDAYGLYQRSVHRGSGVLSDSFGVFSTIENDDPTNETGDITNAYNFFARAYTDKGTGIVGTRYGVYVENATGGGLMTNQYGLYVADQTAGGTTDYGLAIAGADTQVLWLSSGADNTDAANGIAFGSSRDTNLYRSAANTLTTDDSFSSGDDITATDNIQAARYQTNTWYVDAGESISTAYNNASDGDVILLGPGTHTLASGLTISKQITLKGMGRNRTTLNSTVTSSISIRPRVSNITLEDMTITNTSYSAANSYLIYADSAVAGTNIANFRINRVDLVTTINAAAAYELRAVHLVHASGTIEDVNISVSSTNSTSTMYGIYVYTDNNMAGNENPVYIRNTRVSASNTTGASYGLTAYGYSSPPYAKTVYIENSELIADDAGAAQNSAGIYALGSNMTVIAQKSFIQGAADYYDLRQANTAVLTMAGATLGNGTTTGTITYDHEFAAENGYFNSSNVTGTTTSSSLVVSANSLTTGSGLYVASSTLSSGSLIDVAITGTAGLTNQKGINVSLSGANGTGAQTTYGGYFSNTHTGTSTNVGLYATASGGSNNYAAIFDAGNVGVGTTSPLSKLHVAEGDLYVTRNGSDPALVLSDPDTYASEGTKIWYDYSAGDTFFDNIWNNDAGNIYFRTKTAGTPVNALTILGSGNVGVGITAPTAKLDISQVNTGISILTGADVSADSRTNSTRKVTRIGMPHYTNSEEPVGLIFADSDSSYSAINFGGGTAYMNAATILNFYAAADTTTTTGTNVGRITTSGLDLGTSSLLFGSAIGTSDVNLYRSAANTLKTDDDFYAATRIGAGVAPSYAATVNIAETFTQTDSVRYGLYSNATFSPSGALTTNAYVYGNYNKVTWSSAQDGSTYGRIYGAYNYAIAQSSGGLVAMSATHSRAIHQGSGTIGTIYGTYSSVENDDGAGETGDITNAYNFYAAASSNKDTGAIGSRYGLYVADKSSAGPLNNQYGIYLEDLDSASSNNYGIYFAGTSNLARQGIWWNGDTNIYRAGANLLKTDDSFEAASSIDWSGGNVIYVPIGGDIATYVTSATAGDTLVLAAGNYTVTGNITVNKALKIKGQGVGATTITNATAGIEVLYITASNVQISDLTVSTSADSSNSYGIYAYGAGGDNISGVEITNVNIVLGGATTALWGVGTLDASIIARNVKVSGTVNGGVGFRIQNNSNAEAATTSYLYNCNIDLINNGSALYGIYVYDSSATQDVNAYIYDTNVKVTEAVSANNYGLYSNGDNAKAYVYGGSYNATPTDYDLVQATSGTLNIYGAQLVNNTTTGTITYSGYNATGGISFNTSTNMYGLSSEMIKTDDGLTVAKGLYANNSVINHTALNFDGSNDYVSMGDITELNSTATFTLAGWVRQDVIGVGDVIFVKNYADTNNRVYFITSATSSRIYAYISNGGANYGYLDNYNTYMTADRWHHLALVYDGAGATDADKLKLYIDGVYVAFTGFSGSIPATTANMAASTNSISFSSSAFDGDISDFRIYSSAVGASDILTIYQGGTYTTNMVHQYKMFEGGGTTVTDTGSNPLTGTINGAVWTATDYSGLGNLLPTTRLSFATGTTKDSGISFGNDTWLYRSAAGSLSTDGLLKLANGITSPTTSSYGLTFGGATAGTADVNLYRSAANVLKTDDSLMTDGDILLGSDAATTTYSRLVIHDTYPGIRQVARRTPGGVAFSISDAMVYNTSDSSYYTLGGIGIYGNTGTPSTTDYMYFDARSTVAYNAATLKVDNNDRVGMGISSNTRPSVLLHLGDGAPTTAERGIQIGSTDAANLYRSAANTLKTDDALVVTGSLAANGGITFDASSDTVGAFTLSGTIDASTNILTNIGNTGTDFVATTGALTLAGVLTANGGVTVAANQNLSMSSGTGTFSQTYTGTTTTAATITANSLTTGTGLSLASSSLTSGIMLDIAVTGTGGLTNQKGINVSLSGANGTGAQTTYAGYFSNTHTGTSTNVGLYTTASGGSNNYGLLVAAGYSGFGTTAPAAMVHINQATLGSEAFRIESTATNDDPNYSVFQNRVATTDATATTLYSVDLAAGAWPGDTVLFEARVVARHTNGAPGTGASYIRKASFLYTASGLTQLGSTVDDFTGESVGSTSWDCTIDTSGTTVRVTVTGEAGKDITWHSTVMLQNVQQ